MTADGGPKPGRETRRQEDRKTRGDDSRRRTLRLALSLSKGCRRGAEEAGGVGEWETKGQGDKEK